MTVSYLPLANTSAGVVVDIAGNARAGVSLNVYARGTTTPVQVYATASNASPLAQPLITDGLGQIPGFVASPQSVDIHDALTGRTAEVEIIAAADAGGTGVATFNTRAGAVTLSKADVTGTGLAAVDVGADAAGAASAAQAASDPAGSASTEQTRAVAAEALATKKASNLSDVADSDTSRANLRVPVLRECKACSTVNVASLSGTTTIDTIALIAGDRVLLTGQTTATQNGPWVVQAGAWTRPNDYATGATFISRLCPVPAGSANSGVFQLKSSVTVTVDTTATTWASVSGVSGTSLGGFYANDVGNNLALGDSLASIIPSAPLGASAYQNTSVGYQALAGITSGYQNAALGNQALKANTTGFRNTAVGEGALWVSTSGSANVGVGCDSFFSLTTGASNVGVGQSAQRLNISGSNNTAVGDSALNNNTVSDNTAVGYQAAFTNATGLRLTAIGRTALKFSTANDNTAVGYQAAVNVSSGAGNTAVGSNSAFAATTNGNITAVGFNASEFNTGAGNTALGASALAGVNGTSTGANNTALGFNSLIAATTGSSNVGVGHNSLLAVTVGINNVAVGENAGRAIVTNSSNTALGNAAGYTDGTNASTDVISATLVGELAQSALSNVIVLGKAIATRPNLCFGGFPTGAGFFGNGVGVAFLANAVTVPNANPTGGGILYVTAGALTYRGSSGTITTIAVA